MRLTDSWHRMANNKVAWGDEEDHCVLAGGGGGGGRHWTHDLSLLSLLSLTYTHTHTRYPPLTHKKTRPPPTNQPMGTHLLSSLQKLTPCPGLLASFTWFWPSQRALSIMYVKNKSRRSLARPMAYGKTFSQHKQTESNVRWLANLELRSD